MLEKPNNIAFKKIYLRLKSPKIRAVLSKIIGSKSLDFDKKKKLAAFQHPIVKTYKVQKEKKEKLLKLHLQTKS